MVIAPIALTLYIILKLYEVMDGLFKGFLLKAGVYFPGLGMLVTLAILLAAGMLASNWLTTNLLMYLEKILGKIPLIGSIYGIIKDTLGSFSSNKKGFNRLVRINLPDGVKILGFLTNDDDPVFIPTGYVAVYLMQSMQWAGNLILVPAELVETLDVPAEEALKFIASAGLLKGK